MIISLIIIILLIFGFLIGFKRGFTYQLIKMFGVILVLFLSIMLKNKIGLFLFNNCDVLNLNSTIGIFIYQSFAFMILFFIFNIILRLLLKVSKNFEKILNATILLGIPSKILGGVLGFIEYYIYIFFFLIILNIPILNLNIQDSKIANFMLSKTPVVSNKINANIFDEIETILKSGSQSVDQEILDILINKKIISQDDAYKLIKNGKIKNVEIKNEYP